MQTCWGCCQPLAWVSLNLQTLFLLCLCSWKSRRSLQLGKQTDNNDNNSGCLALPLFLIIWICLFIIMSSLPATVWSVFYSFWSPLLKASDKFVEPFCAFGTFLKAHVAVQIVIIILDLISGNYFNSRQYPVRELRTWSGDLKLMCKGLTYLASDTESNNMQKEIMYIYTNMVWAIFHQTIVCCILMIAICFRPVEFQRASNNYNNIVRHSYRKPRARVCLACADSTVS